MHHIIIQHANKAAFSPNAAQLKRIAKSTLNSKKMKSAEVTIRIVDKEEMTTLNARYRHKQKSTNVLSFPAMLPEDVKMNTPMLGDIVICADVVNEEAENRGKTREAHWAHMVVHGVLHLLGYNHEEDDEAVAMESLEIKILQQLGFKNPYE